MSVNKRFSTNSKGAIIFTGNTLGLYGTLNPPQAGRVAGTNDHNIDGIGAFISTNTNLVANGGYPQGSTTDWKLNSSAAVLDLPEKATVLYAELFWGGTSRTQIQDITTFTNNPIKLILPNGSSQFIEPTPSSAQDLPNVLDTSLSQYLRSADVTALVQEHGSGLYTIGSIPGALGHAGGNLGPSESCSLAWTLAVVIEDYSQPYRYMCLWSTLDLVCGGPHSATLDLFTDEFTTPAVGPVNGRLLLSALSGANHLPGDIVKFGADPHQLITLHGPNNPGVPTPNNFFQSQINNGNSLSPAAGLLDARGTCGTLNQQINISGLITKSINAPVAVRQGLDLTNISVNDILPNRTSRAFLRFESTQDTYFPIVIATQLDIDSPIISITTSSDSHSALPGDVINFTVSIKNTGSTTAKDFYLTQHLSPGLTVQPNTLTINGVPSKLSDLTHLPIGSIAPNTIAVLNFNAQIVEQPPINLMSYAFGEYIFSNYREDFIIKGTARSTDLSFTVNYARLASSIKVDKSKATLDETVTYTLTIENQGTISANQVTLTDILSDSLTYTPKSLLINGQADYQDIQQSITLPTIPPSSHTTLVYQAQVTNPQADEHCLIKPNLSYNYPSSPQKIISVEMLPCDNHAITELLYSDLVSDDNFSLKTNRIEAIIGDVITYTIRLSNKGNCDAQNIRLEHLIPNHCSYEANSLTINQRIISGTDLPYIQIETLTPNQELWITYSVKIDTKPDASKIQASVKLSYQYNVNNETSEMIEKKYQSQPAITQLKEGRIEPQYAILSANKKEVTPGDFVTYKLLLKNTGNLEVVDIFIHNLLAPGITLKPNSVRALDSKRAVNFNPVDGLSLSNLGPGEEIILALDAVVTDSAEQIITSQGTISFSYSLPNHPKKITDQLSTNSLSITNLKPSISVETTPSHTGAIIGDVVTYTINITNTGPLNLSNLLCKNPLSNHLEYANNLLVNDTTFFGDITRGIKIEELAMGDKVKITFDAKVISFPNKLAKEVINRSEVSYYFRLDHQAPYFTSTNYSNTSNIKIFNPSLSTTMKADKPSTQIGDLVEYTIQIINNGNVNILEAALSNPFPDGLEIESIMINGYRTMDNPLYGIELGPITAGQSINILLTVRVLENYKEANPFCNKAHINYTILTTDRTLPRERSIQCIDTVGVSIISPKLQLDKYQAFEQVVVGEKIFFTIQAANTGTVPLYNVIIQELLPHQLKLVPSSMSIDGTHNQESVLRGINIGTLEVNQTKTIHYHAEVLIKDEGVIESSANAQYQYKLNAITPIANGIAHSNTLETRVKRASLLLNLTSNCNTAFLNEDITYSLTVKNDGDMDALGVIISSTLPTNVLFIPDSFSLNNQIIYGVNIDEGVNIGSIPIGRTMTIQYKLKLVTNNNENQLVTAIVAKFSFIRENQAMSFIETTSNEDAITTTISAFKQITLDKHLSLPAIKPDLVDINNIISDGQITDCYTVHTLSGVSTQGQILTGYKLILHGMINILIEYTSKDLSQTIYSSNYNIPFSTYLVVSSAGYKNCANNVDLIIDHVSHGGISDRSFYINISLLAVAL